MDIEEVKKFLAEDSKGKKLLAELVEDHEALTGLKTKNADLIASNKKLKKERDDGVTEITELKTELEEKGKGAPDVQAEVEKATKKIMKELETEKTKNGELSTKIQKQIVESGLSDALIKANIAKNHIPAVKALLKSENKIEIDETDNVAKIGDKDISTFVTEWAQGDMGKNYVAASQNNGGGANGSKGGTTATNDDILKMSPKQRLTYGRQQQGKK